MSRVFAAAVDDAYLQHDEPEEAGEIVDIFGLSHYDDYYYFSY